MPSAQDSYYGSFEAAGMAVCSVLARLAALSPRLDVRAAQIPFLLASHGGSMPYAQLRDSLAVDAPTLSRMVATWESLTVHSKSRKTAEPFVESTTADQSKRERVLQLTKNGDDFVQNLLKV